MSDLFLSYAAEDRERARRLAELLATKGWSVWWDREIHPGASFDRAIERAIEHARGVVVLWSRSSVESDWVRAEAREGLGRRVLIPVLIEDVRIPLEFRSIQAATLLVPEVSPDDPEARTLFAAIADILGQAQTSVPGPVAGPSPPRRGWMRPRVAAPVAVGAVAVTLALVAWHFSGGDQDPAASAGEVTGASAPDAQAAIAKQDDGDPAEGEAPDPGVLRRLRLGSKGQDVVDLRATLRALGYIEGRGSAADENVFGPETHDAVVQFQKDRNLVPDGIVGPQLLGEFKRLARAAGRAPAP